MSNKTDEILREKYLLKFQTYEDYLESLITPRDLYHLRSKSIARQIIELGYHTEGTLDRESFYEHVKLTERYLFLKKNPFALCSKNIEIKDLLLQELAAREQFSRRGEIFTIIFIRHIGKDQSQISAFIDYTDRLKTEDWKPYFEGLAKITPKKSDLSYYDWKVGKSMYNESPNFKPMIDGKKGLVFESLRDSNLIRLDTSLNLKSNPRRVPIFSEIYGNCIIYDYLGEICDCNIKN